MYYDETPPGAPPQQITQCQQWGFQRLVPCIDDMTAKCTYTTTIIADERYTNLITNGNVVIPAPASRAGRVKITYENTLTPMAPYLFFLGCGTWATFTQECEYPDGRQCTLELLVPPASDPVIAEYALNILHDAVLWVNLFTGPGRYTKSALRERIYLLMRGTEPYQKNKSVLSAIAEKPYRTQALIEQIVPVMNIPGLPTVRSQCRTRISGGWKTLVTRPSPPTGSCHFPQ